MDKTGEPAVAFELQDMAGAVHRHVDYLGAWQLLVFHRHLG